MAMKGRGRTYGEGGDVLRQDGYRFGRSESQGAALTGRNSELIRQWTILQRIGTARGQTIPKLAKRPDGQHPDASAGIWEALQVAGFPVYDETRSGLQVLARVDARAMGVLARTGLTLSELAALYFEPRARRMLRGDGVAKRHHERKFDNLRQYCRPP